MAVNTGPGGAQPFPLQCLALSAALCALGADTRNTKRECVALKIPVKNPSGKRRAHLCLPAQSRVWGHAAGLQLGAGQPG